MKIFIYTQYRENYGDAEQPYWKNKGGDTYVVENFTAPLNDQLGAVARIAVERASRTIEQRSDYSATEVIDWEIVYDDGQLTEDERLQLEYDGRITYPSPRADCFAAHR